MHMRVFRAAAARQRLRRSGIGRGGVARLWWGALAAGFLALCPAVAQETISYSYDARGRLVQVAHSGSVNAGVTASYAYDKADNRSNVTVAVGGTGSPSFSINDVSATEGSALVFTVTRSGSTAGTDSVQYATGSGSATATSDYTAVGLTTLTFSAGQTTKSVNVATIDDSLVEGSETVSVNLSSPSSGATISDAQGIGTILDNDASGGTCAGVSFTIASNAAVAEGTSSVFTITKTGSTSSSCTVSYATANGTAAAPGDYTAKSATLTFTAAQTSKTVSVATTDDATVESAETFTMSLSAPGSGATLGTPSSATATINDNDSSNSPPITQADSIQLVCKTSATVNVTANDSDPEGNLPLTVTNVVVNSGDAFATVYSSSSIEVTAAQGKETATATYTVKDSLNASSTGTLTIKSVGAIAQCDY